MAGKFDPDSLSDEERESLEEIHEIVDAVEDALFKTFLSADNRGNGRDRHDLRMESKCAWRKVTEMFAVFAKRDD